MSLIERLFPASELAALKHAVLVDDDERAAKRRKVERTGSIKSSYSNADSGYNSDESTYAKSTSSVIHEADSPASSTCSDEDNFCTKIAEARARLYSSASLDSPSSPVGESEPRPEPPAVQEVHHSPVSVESLAEVNSTSGFGLATFVRLGLAVTNHERNLLTALAPVPKAMPLYRTAEMRAKKLQWLQRRRSEILRQKLQLVEQQRRMSYHGFAISQHDEEEEEEEQDQDQDQDREQEDELELQIDAATIDEAVRPNAKTTVLDEPLFATPMEQLDDFFNLDAACEPEESI